jgi:hypothetical protein
VAGRADGLERLATLFTEPSIIFVRSVASQAGHNAPPIGYVWPIIDLSHGEDNGSLLYDNGYTLDRNVVVARWRLYRKEDCLSSSITGSMQVPLLKENEMPMFMIERNFAEQLDVTQDDQIKVAQINSDIGVQ